MFHVPAHKAPASIAPGQIVQTLSKPDPHVKAVEALLRILAYIEARDAEENEAPECPDIHFHVDTVEQVKDIAAEALRDIAAIN